MSIDLGGLQRGMTEEFLHDPQVGTTIEHVCCRAVPQGVRTQTINAKLFTGPRHHGAHHPRINPPTPSPEKQGVVSRFFRIKQVGAAMVAPRLERRSGRVPKGDDTLFIPLPGDFDGVSGIVHVRKINAAEFGHSAALILRT